jgi:hypothetical protein
MTDEWVGTIEKDRRRAEARIAELEASLREAEEHLSREIGGAPNLDELPEWMRDWQSQKIALWQRIRATLSAGPAKTNEVKS